MHKFLSLPQCLPLICLCLPLLSQAHEPGRPATLAPLLKRTMPAVVNIRTEGVQVTSVNPWFQDPFFKKFFSFPSRSRTVRNIGSGVILNAQLGYVVTNYHVLQGADRITVALEDGRSLQAEVVGRDQDSDLALIKIEPKRLTEVPLADADRIQVGDYVVAIGNPFGFSHTVTQGIVSGVGRNSVLKSKQPLIQTDASINPGNSGGALLNYSGELVGVNTAIYNPSGGGNIGIGFAIPCDTVQLVTDHLIRFGQVRRSFIGIEGQPLDEALATGLSLAQQQTGIIVMQLQVGSDAASFGVRPGDVITALNQRPIERVVDLINNYEYLLPDSRIELSVIRDKRRIQITGQVGQGTPVQLEGGQINAHLTGVVLTEIVVYEGQDVLRSRVTVQSVSDNAQVRRFGVQAKDVITRINDQPINVLNDLTAYAKQSSLLLEFNRDGSSYRLNIR